MKKSIFKQFSRASLDLAKEGYYLESFAFPGEFKIARMGESLVSILQSARGRARGERKAIDAVRSFLVGLMAGRKA